MADGPTGTTQTAQPDGAPVIGGAWQPMLATRAVTEQRVQDIVFTPMCTTRRNNLITVAYGDLAAAMADVLRRDGEDTNTDQPNWCTYSQWPSSAVRELLRIPIPGIGRAIKRAFAHGNRGVFCDIGQAYVAFLAAVGAARPASMPDAAETMERCVAMLARMRPPPGRPLRGPSPQPTALVIEGVQMPAPPEPWMEDLVKGLACYAASLATDAPAVRAQRVYAGNVLLAAHEQRWLDESLAFGMRVPTRRFLRPILNVKRQISVHRHDVAPGPLLGLEEWVIHRATRRMVAFTLNGVHIAVGQDLPDDTTGQPRGGGRGPPGRHRRARRMRGRGRAPLPAAPIGGVLAVLRAADGVHLGALPPPPRR